MKIILSAILFIFTLQSQAQTNSDFEKGDYSPKEYKTLVKDSEKFEKLKYTKAVKKFGEPYETEKIEITSEALDRVLSDDLIKEHFPKNETQKKEPYLLEASWKLLSESWITVWYKFENSKWMPINILIAI